MAGGYKTPAGDSWGPLLDELSDIRRRLRELEIPTGTSVASMVSGQPSFDAKNALTTNFAIPGDVDAVVANVTFTVPPGMSRALVSATVMVRGQNFTATPDDYIRATAVIGGVPGGGTYGSSAKLPNGEIGTALAANTQSIEGLAPGDAITVEAFASVTSAGGPPTPAWAATMANAAAVTATVIFLR